MELEDCKIGMLIQVDPSRKIYHSPMRRNVGSISGLCTNSLGETVLLVQFAGNSIDQDGPISTIHPGAVIPLRTRPCNACANGFPLEKEFAPCCGRIR